MGSSGDLSQDEDSDFYGSDYVTLTLESRVASFDIDRWNAQQETTPSRPQRCDPRLQANASLHNPYEGIRYAWQLNETVNDFLARIPPATTDCGESIPWIYICNPYIPRVTKSQAQSQLCKGNEDEGPEEEGSDLQRLLDGGSARLDMLNDFTNRITKFNKPPSFVSREVQNERKEAIEDILNLSHACRVRTGKWMLFCAPTEVNAVWEVVAKATANNELGIAAKVAPRPVSENRTRDRLICVYTADFKNKIDVGRVLVSLRGLRLVEARSKRIYYKADAFTYLGISSGNPWGIKASLYSSSEMFPR